MASRYWVGGAADWNTTAGTKWALTSGGTGGEAVPTSADDVFFDANSGNVSVRIGGLSARSCANLDFSGFTGTINHNSPSPANIEIFGNLILSSAMTITVASGNGVGFKMKSTSTGKTITTNGQAIPTPFTLDGVGGGWTLQDDFIGLVGIGAPALTLTNGSFDANGFDVTFGRFSSNNSNTRTLTMGNGTWTLDSSIGFWDMATTTGLTFSANSSTIISNFKGSTYTFAGGGLTYNNVVITPTLSATLTITGSNTFNSFTVTPIGAVTTILFEAGTTQTVTSFISNGNNKRNVYKSVTNGSTWTISAASGLIRITNASLQDSTATGGATFRAENTTDVSGNTGWLFGNLGGFFDF